MKPARSIVSVSLPDSYPGESKLITDGMNLWRLLSRDKSFDGFTVVDVQAKRWKGFANTKKIRASLLEIIKWGVRDVGGLGFEDITCASNGRRAYRFWWLGSDGHPLSSMIHLWSHEGRPLGEWFPEQNKTSRRRGEKIRPGFFETVILKGE